jgi:hypothetical protein
LLFICICHQFNWDFLQGALFEAFVSNLKNTESWAKSISSSDVSQILAKYPKQERVRASERSKTLRETAEVIFSSPYFKELFDNSEPTITLDGDSGFYEQLKSIPAFKADPLMKKSAVLVHDIFREKICKVTDKDNMMPAVDYHIQRSYIKTGRVFSIKGSVTEALVNRTDRRVRLVQLFRKNVSDAMNLTSLYSGLSIADLNYAEWQIARNICTETDPKCSSRQLEDLPNEFKTLESTECPFYSSCRSIDDPHYEKMLLQPAYSKNFF